MALIINRKKGESFRIGDDIIVTIYEADRGRTKIGVEAPEHVKILRTELIYDGPRPRPCND